MLSAVNSTGGAWLMIESTVFVVVGLWIVINAVFWPLVISKALIGGGSHALSWMSQSLSPVMTVGQQTTSVATTMASGGSAAAGEAGGPKLGPRARGWPTLSRKEVCAQQ